MDRDRGRGFRPRLLRVELGGGAAFPGHPDVLVPGGAYELNPELDKAARVEDFLELGSAGTIVGILNEAGADEALLNRFKALKCRELSADDTEVLLHNLKSLIEQSTKQLYERVVCPLVFYIGITGILPDMIESEILNAESLATRFPTLKLSKTDHTKTFYQLGSSLISVYAHSKYFSVP